MFTSTGVNGGAFCTETSSGSVKIGCSKLSETRFKFVCKLARICAILRRASSSASAGDTTKSGSGTISVGKRYGRTSTTGSREPATLSDAKSFGATNSEGSADTTSIGDQESVSIFELVCEIAVSSFASRALASSKLSPGLMSGTQPVYSPRIISSASGGNGGRRRIMVSSSVGMNCSIGGAKVGSSTSLMSHTGAVNGSHSCAGSKVLSSDMVRTSWEALERLENSSLGAFCAHVKL